MIKMDAKYMKKIISCRKKLGDAVSYYYENIKNNKLEEKMKTLVYSLSIRMAVVTQIYKRKFSGEYDAAVIDAYMALDIAEIMHFIKTLEKEKIDQKIKKELISRLDSLETEIILRN